MTLSIGEILEQNEKRFNRKLNLTLLGVVGGVFVLMLVLTSGNQAAKTDKQNVAIKKTDLLHNQTVLTEVLMELVARQERGQEADPQALARLKDRLERVRQSLHTSSMEGAQNTP